jgi:hypothetical protein
VEKETKKQTTRKDDRKENSKYALSSASVVQICSIIF